MNLDKLSIFKETSDALICFCPFHEDLVHPNLVINKTDNLATGKRKGYYYCFACGAYGDVSEKDVDKLSNFPSKECVTKYYNKNWFKLVVDSLVGRLRQDYPRDFIYDDSSADWLIGWKDNRYVYPMYNECCEVIGVQTRNINGQKRYIKGSNIGIFLPYQILTRMLSNKTLEKSGPSIPTGLSSSNTEHSGANLTPCGGLLDYGIEEVFICEGLSDSLVAYCCLKGNNNYPEHSLVIGLPQATFGHNIVKKFLTNIDFCGIIKVIWDADEAGVKSTEKLIDCLSSWKVYTIWTLPYKDLRDYYNEKGREETIKLLKG